MGWKEYVCLFRLRLKCIEFLTIGAGNYKLSKKILDVVDLIGDLMNCPSCKMQLDFPEGVLKQLTRCPFCGSELLREKSIDTAEPMSREKGWVTLLKKMINQHGMDICSAERADEFAELLKQNSESDRNSTIVLTLFLQYGLLSDLYDSVSVSANDRKETIKSVVDVLYRKFDIPTDKGLQMTFDIAACFGINVKGINSNSLKKSSLSALIQKYIEENGIYKFGMVESIGEIAEACDNVVDRSDAFVLLRSGISLDMRNALGEDAGKRSELFMEFVNRLKSYYIPEAKAFSIVRKLADGLGFSTENQYFIDERDRQSYRIVNIGNQTWMAENFRYRIHNSFFYNNDEKTVDRRGILYTWHAAQEACPKGWRLPTREDYNELEAFVLHDIKFEFDDTLDRAERLNDYLDRKCSFLEKCLKPKDEDDGMDFFGFSAVPGGRIKLLDGSYGVLEENENAEYWTSSVDDTPLGGKDCMHTYTIGLPSSKNMYEYALPVRYIKGDAKEVSYEL